MLLHRHNSLRNGIGLSLLCWIILLLLLSGCASNQPTAGRNEKAKSGTKAVPWCVAEDRGDVKPEYDITNGAFIIHWGKVKGSWGEAEYEAHPDQNMVFCELWIEKKPKKVWGDPEMDTLGHELGHCLWGDFHPDYED